ncbi:NAD(P)-dependent oxidoreductase [Pseudomonas sp. PD9R]|uniref:NAD-dependent epimerase/dehydratase family protein n=1 Tax=Pseudomonas sp. PD9R TaxID=2853534 RepID=UPI001C473FA1|nr:NAD-dependent epimerase/dehydratase family protein [Pseudomonas sp. PD9R]MBV6824258.1 NAD-dependent epimerase/dehydratase family protein [Pseudomonas sp. PD9R]
MPVMAIERHVICLTGAFGFIGQHLLPMLIGQGVTVRILTRNVGRNAVEGVETHVGDLFDPISLGAFLADARLLINLAHPSGQLSDERYSEGIGNLAKAAKQAGVHRVLHISTAMVVGVPPQRVVSESTTEHPVTDYERQKLNAEKIFHRELHGIADLGILRPTAVFGRGGQNLLKLAGTIAGNSFFSRRLFRFIHGQRHMHLVSVNEVVAAIVFLAFGKRPLEGNVFLISADDEPTNHYQAVDSILGAVLGKPMPDSGLCLPATVLKTLLKLVGRSQADPRLIYDAGKLYSWGFRRSVDFEAELQYFAQNYLAENCTS